MVVLMWMLALTFLFVSDGLFRVVITQVRPIYGTRGCKTRAREPYALRRRGLTVSWPDVRPKRSESVCGDDDFLLRLAGKSSSHQTMPPRILLLGGGSSAINTIANLTLVEPKPNSLSATSASFDLVFQNWKLTANSLWNGGGYPLSTVLLLAGRTRGPTI
jgi:hypothetical protein